MYKTITKSEFTAAFHNMGRGDQFSHDAMCAIYDYMEEYGMDCELDVIAVCCDWVEYDSALAAATDYGQTFDCDEDEQEDEALEWLQGETTVLPLGDDRVVFVQF